jgi:HK97 family phage major capsid protein
VKAAVEEQLKTIDTGSKFQLDHVSVKHNWKAETAEYLKLLAKREKTSSELDRMAELTEKSAKSYIDQSGMDAKTLGFEAGTDASGGYWMAPTFDMEVDKLVYEFSPLLNLIRVRQGGEKTEINSISTFDFNMRTNEDTAYTAKTPTLSQEELKYRDAGGLMSIGMAALSGSAYNVISELTELAADARIRYLEQIILTGLAASDGFNGIHFISGIGSAACAATNGTGGIVSKDLSNLLGAVASPARPRAKFVMNWLELCRITDERDNNGQPTNQVMTTPDGKFIHKPTGKEIIVSDLGYRLLNGVTNKTAGSNVPVICGDLSRFRFYQVGGMKIKTSNEFYFDKEAIALLMAIRFKQGVPTQSKTSFATLTGVKSVAI